MSDYEDVLLHVFHERHQTGADRVDFELADLREAANSLGVTIANLADNMYAYRFRRRLPDQIRQSAPDAAYWILELRGRGKYSLIVRDADDGTDEGWVVPGNTHPIKVPDATPSIVAENALTDEQALLAKLRYNRLVDVFTKVTCYSLQNHLRASTYQHGQVEVDEVYLGIARQGAQFAFPVEAKGGSDNLSIVQIEQGLALAKEKWPDLICRPVAASFTGASRDLIALFMFAEIEGKVVKVEERSYQLVGPNVVTSDERATYNQSALLEDH